MKEKYIRNNIGSSVKFEENKLQSFYRINEKVISYRLYEDGKVGFHLQVGETSDEDGYAKAGENLENRPRPYDFELETGVRYRDMVERKLTDKELIDTANECVEFLRQKYPQYVCSVGFYQNETICSMTNDKGLDYRNRDCAIEVGVTFKHEESKDIQDGHYSFSLRNFDKEVFMKMTDNYLGNFEKEVELPTELIMDMQYYGLLGKLSESLDGENLARGTSLLSGRLGEKVFSEKFSLWHDISDKECWFNPFWDGEGCVIENDKSIFIDRGVVLRGYSDKKTARKYSIPHTANAYVNYADIPGAGNLNYRITRNDKTVKELLNGRLAVVPVMYTDKGFMDNGDYVVPINTALLTDGEKILGRVPSFTMRTNMFDMFGDDFIGVGSDNPIYNDKQILFRVNKGEI